MKQIVFLLLYCTTPLCSQETIEAVHVKSTEIALKTIVAIDNFGIFYHIDNNIFHKVETQKNSTYSNVQLGQITVADAFNPLKINLFYKNFNTVVILDNRLAEIYKIDFNTIQPYKNVSHISTGYDTTLWIFNIATQQLELFDYKTNKVRATTLPVASHVLDLVSNYNYCWLLTEQFLYQYNYFGSLIQKIKNDAFTKLDEDNGNLVIKQHGKLLYLPKDSETFLPIALNGLLINQFLLTNETLYIYDSETLHTYQLKIK